MALEGKFSDSGLQDLDDGEVVLTALARELVMKQGVGESADAIWKLLQIQQPAHQPEEEIPLIPPKLAARPEPTLRPVTPLAVFTQMARPARRRHAPPVAEDQLSLF